MCSNELFWVHEYYTVFQKEIQAFLSKNAAFIIEAHSLINKLCKQSKKKNNSFLPFSTIQPHVE